MIFIFILIIQNKMNFDKFICLFLGLNLFIVVGSCFIVQDFYNTIYGDCVVSYQNNNEFGLISFGGFVYLDEPLKYQSRVRRLSVGDGMWSDIISDSDMMPVAVIFPNCVYDQENDIMYVFGGMNSLEQRHQFGNLWKFDFHDTTWTLLKSQSDPTTPQISIVAHVTMILREDKIYLLDREVGQVLSPTIYSYDLIEENWSIVYPPKEEIDIADDEIPYIDM